MNSLDLVNELTKALTKLEDKYGFLIVNNENEELVRLTVQAVINDNYNHKLGELEAKCYTYEKIIANSNFYPLIESDWDIGEDGMKINKKDLMLTLDEIVNCESVRLCEVDRDLYEFIQGDKPW